MASSRLLDDVDRRRLPIVARHCTRDLHGYDIRYERVTIIGDSFFRVDYARA